ncbi:unnamed protein product [Danaus chrysippus]|uniref:(African queen) hypothetical protein n=1 Tax=Danaus chrysippus TaxID=151541 RepID=A0A8J2R367_9NEOP|nr:unnamed protein product [Danaus chrysippus]
MFHTHGYHNISDMKLTNSASDQNVYFTYVCLINEVNPSFSKNDNGMNSTDHGQDPPSIRTIEADDEDDEKNASIKVERSKALHELVESHRHEYHQGNKYNASPKLNRFDEDSEPSDDEECRDFPNPKQLKLTKMKWLSEGREGSMDSSSPSISPFYSSSSLDSRESDDVIGQQMSFGEKCLSTILKLDREHNMFGLSNIAIVGKKISKKNRKEDDKPVFPQTAIIQICCGKKCCRYRVFYHSI